jgi:hypothetical protein
MALPWQRLIFSSLLSAHTWGVGVSGGVVGGSGGGHRCTPDRTAPGASSRSCYSCAPDDRHLFIDEDLGLCSPGAPTRCRFGLPLYLNGHDVLAAKLRKAGVEFRMLDNPFTRIADG